MATRKTWLLAAAERREFDGILKRFGDGEKRADIRAEFAREISAHGDRWLLIANGPGAASVDEGLKIRMEVDGMISTGFCGALDPALRVGDIVHEVLTLDRVAVTAAEKRELREKTQARAVDMESAAIGRKAAEWGVSFRVIRAVSDTAGEDMPLDFNSYRDAEGRFSRTRIALAALARPFAAVPGLLRLDRNCRVAAESIGEFFAHSRL
jgi:adenosylhomocysteine nucleosidase